jgi:tetratricopeptide (TPR) repeat protein
MNLAEIVTRQKILGRRLVWLLALPFAITAAIVPMFFVLSARVSDLELATKIVTIERYFLVDKNPSWAIDQYEQITQKKPTAPILTRLGTLYFERNHGDRDTAIAKLMAAQAIDPTYWETYRILTYIYTVTNQPQRAIETGRKALQLNAYDANTYNNLALVYATAKDPPYRNLSLALEYADKATKLTNEMQSNFLDTLAEVYLQRGEQGDKEAALKYLRKAVELSSRRDLRHHEERLLVAEKKEADGEPK